MRDMNYMNMICDLNRPGEYQEALEMDRRRAEEREARRRKEEELRLLAEEEPQSA